MTCSWAPELIFKCYSNETSYFIETDFNFIQSFNIIQHLGNLTINFWRHNCRRDDFRAPSVCFFCSLYFGGSKDALHCPKVMETRGKKTKKTTSKNNTKENQTQGKGGEGALNLNLSSVVCIWIALVPRSPLDRASLVKI